MLPIILIAAAVIVGLFLVFIATRPAEFRVTRTGRINAPADVVFENVNTLRKWDAWSPWAKLDPNCKNTFSGPESGPGSVMAWSGNKKVGEGRMTIIESRPAEFIGIKLEFIKPFPATNETLFTFKPHGDQTLMTWEMAGRHNFISKIFCTFMNMDKMVGGQFEQGLGKLKKIVEQVGSKV